MLRETHTVFLLLSGGVHIVGSVAAASSDNDPGRYRRYGYHHGKLYAPRAIQMYAQRSIVSIYYLPQSRKFGIATEPEIRGDHTRDFQA